MKKVGTAAGFVALVLSNVSGQVLQIKPLLDNLEGQVFSADVSPDGKILAFQWCSPNFERCGIYTRPVAGGPMKLLVSGAGMGMPSWSPDGKMIAFTDTRDRWDVRLVVWKRSCLSTRRPSAQARPWKLLCSDPPGCHRTSDFCTSSRTRRRARSPASS